MSNTLTLPLELATIPIETEQKDHRFFDPKAPDMPEQVLGVESEAVLRLGRAALNLGMLPPAVNIGLYALPYALQITPLIEHMQSGVPLEPEDVRPYRKPIKHLSLGLNTADKLSAAAGAVAVGIPLRRALNRKIEREFPGRAAEAIAKAREAVANAESEVDFVASFENPREQFVSEVNGLAQTVSAAITKQRDSRVRSGVVVEPEPLRGIFGFFTKVARKVRSFFRFGRKPQVNPEVTAHDAGAGIKQVVDSLRQNPAVAEARAPMLSKLLLNRLPARSPLTRDKLALGAPEILQFLFSMSTDHEVGQELIDSVLRNPHDLRFATRFVKRVGRIDLENIQRASYDLFPAIRDILPTEGRKVREIYDRLQDLLRYQPPIVSTEPIPESATAGSKKGVRARLKAFFRRRRTQN